MVEGRTHKPVVLPDRCHTCDICIRGCPAEVLPEYQREEKSLRGSLYLGKMEERPQREKLSLPPCQQSCPIHQDTKSYVALIARGKFREALESIREVNPLPAVCGFICHHPCEEACLREGVDYPIPIRLLKRFVAEYERKTERAKGGVRKTRRGTVLVVGSGPAGLAAANDLRLLGYGVTILEALPVFGGMLAVGIPEFRLPRDILDFEIEGIRKLGVEMKGEHPFRFEGNGTALHKLGFQAAFLSIGAHSTLALNIPGEKLKGVLPGVEFLRQMNLRKSISIGKQVAVIGGGNVALDVARSAIRLGAELVEVYYRRSRAEMPAIPDEVDEAIREGIRIHFLAAPVRIIGRGERAIGIDCLRTKLGEKDSAGRRIPVPIEGSHFRVRADTIVAAIGQKIPSRALKEFDTHPDGRIRVDPESGETSMRGVFAGGDVVTGPGWAIDAIAAGKKGARAIHQFLSA